MGLNLYRLLDVRWDTVNVIPVDVDGFLIVIRGNYE